MNETFKPKTKTKINLFINSPQFSVAPDSEQPDNVAVDGV